MSVETGNTGDPLADKLAALTALSFPHFFVGQKLTSDLLNASGDVTRQQLSYLGRMLAGCGVLEGLEIQQPIQEVDNPSVIIRAGVAIDPLGRLIVVPEDAIIPRTYFDEVKDKDSFSFEIILHLATKRSDSEPKDKYAWINHGFKFQIREIDLSDVAENESKAPTQPFHEFVHKHSAKLRRADTEGVSLGVVTLQKAEFRVRNQTAGEDRHRQQIVSLDTFSRFLASHRRIVSLRAESSHFQRTTVHFPSMRHTVRLVDLNGCGVGNVSLEVAAGTAEVQLRNCGNDDWQKHGESLSVQTDEHGRIHFECLTTTPGFFVLNVFMCEQADGLTHAQPVQISILAEELLIWNEPGPIHAIPGESVTLRAEFRALKNPQEHGYLEFHESEHPGRIIRGHADPKNSSVISALWTVRRLGYNTIVASFHSRKGILANVNISVIGEPTRVVVVAGNHQRCLVGEQLPAPVTLRVEKLDQTPLKDAMIKLSGSTWDIEIGIASDSFIHESDKTRLRTNEDGEVQFRWAPQEYGSNMITASHIVRNLNSSGQTKQGDETQISMNEVCLFAQCLSAPANEESANSQDTNNDTNTDNDNRTENE